MKTIHRICLILICLVVLLSACGQANTEIEETTSTLTYQDYYDLGVRYLLESNYEEAIIAFTAAIEIDPKQAPAYVGRGDAHTGVANSISAGVSTDELPEEAWTNYQKAIADYLAAIERNVTATEAYMKAAANYVVLGDIETAIDLLKQGYEATGDSQLQEHIIELESLIALSNEHGIIETVGQIFLIGDIYRDKIEAFMDAHSTGDGGIIVRNSNCGVYFNEPVETEVDGIIVSIAEAEFAYYDVIEDDSLLFVWSEGDRGDQIPGELLGRDIILKGYFTLNPQQEEFEGPKYEYIPGEPTEDPLYDFQPTGPYVFHLVSYEMRKIE